MDLFFATAPIILLVYLMAKPNGVPSQKALPLVALVMYLVKLIYFADDPNQINATVVNGLLSSLVPVSIIGGAILLFKTMEASGAMNTIRGWLNSISNNSVAQLMIIGWAFSFMIEGASGFGTPAALAGPILVSLGLPVFRVAVLCLIMNSVPVSFGAVGTPTWFGFSTLLETMAPAVKEQFLADVGYKTVILHGVASLVIPVVAMMFVIKWKDLKKNLAFVYLSIASCVVPYFLLGMLSYEFPSLIGGMIGFGLTIWLAKKGIGLQKDGVPECEGKRPVVTMDDIDSSQMVSGKQLVKSLFPLWGTVVVLLLTRIRQLGIKDLLNSSEGGWGTDLGSLGHLNISESLVVSLSEIFRTDTVWSFKLLYVPSLIPFVLISACTFVLYKMPWAEVKGVFKETGSRLVNPFLALLGALVYVRLIMSGGESATTVIIGNSLAASIGESWQYFAAYLGALGSFFSGSNTVSNLTFGAIQFEIAKELGLETTTILALQSVGGAMGNMVCINNIVAICSILGLSNSEGRILRWTAGPMLLYGIVVGLAAALLL